MIPICMPSHRNPRLFTLGSYGLNKENFTLTHDNQRCDSSGRKCRIEYSCDECSLVYVTKLRDEIKKKYPWLCRSCRTKKHWKDDSYRNALIEGITEETRKFRRKQRRQSSLKMWNDPKKRKQISKRLRERPPEVYSKARRSMRTSIIMFHWKTGEELICVGSYEVAFVNWCNKNNFDYDWQIPHKMPDGRTYIVDAYVKDGPLNDYWVEIKGFFSDVGKQKWQWFSSTIKNAKLLTHDELKKLDVL